MCLYLPFKYWNTFNNATFKWFWTIFSLGAPDFLCQFASSKKSKNIYSGKDTSIIRWPKRRVTALQIVRTSFLGPRPRLFPPTPHLAGNLCRVAKNSLRLRELVTIISKQGFMQPGPCLCDFLSVASPGRDRLATFIPTPTLFLCLQRKQTVTVPS